jgi:hypothetical protein
MGKECRQQVSTIGRVLAGKFGLEALVPVLEELTVACQLVEFGFELILGFWIVGVYKNAIDWTYFNTLRLIIVPNAFCT